MLYLSVGLQHLIYLVFRSGSTAVSNAIVFSVALLDNTLDWAASEIPLETPVSEIAYILSQSHAIVSSRNYIPAQMGCEREVYVSV